MPLNGTTAATALCEDVHIGGVEICRDGPWGRICNDLFYTRAEEFMLDAQVVCRQLGFPFGGVMDVDEVRDAYGSQDNDYDDEAGLVWATTVRHLPLRITPIHVGGNAYLFGTSQRQCTSAAWANAVAFNIVSYMLWYGELVTSVLRLCYLQGILICVHFS